MTEPAPEVVYKNRIQDLTSQIKRLKKKRDTIAWMRLSAILVIFACFFFLRSYGLAYAFIPAIVFFALFLRLVVLSGRNNEAIKNLDLLRRINEMELSIAAGNYVSLPDGKQYLPPTHDYAPDLDIFGRASIYQYINRTTSEQGHLALATWLLAPADAHIVMERQHASIELRSQYEWRQQLQAYGLAGNITLSTQQKINRWIIEPDLFTKPHWKWLRYLMPALIFFALLLNVLGTLPSPLFYGVVFIFFLLSGAISRRVNPVYLHLDKIVNEIATLSRSIAWIEQQNSSSPYLGRLLHHFIAKKAGASAQVQRLKNILDRLEYRLNPLVFIPLNTFLFWDLQQVLALEKWKHENHTSVSAWFDALGEMEALASLAAVSFNHPGWSFPVLSNVEGALAANDLGHPLIPLDKRVCSSFQTQGTAKIALITGSNMAGKSTFLRSVGVNIVLAMAGSPVCAKTFSLYPVKVISSMRVNDNLEESTSTFYAELKKLKYIIEAVNRGEKIFLLLDEILRGTNSLDRHTGSKALINQLIRKNAVGIMATHDLELAGLVKDYPQNIRNYHFDVQVSEEELYFDYKLKDGVCKSLNASILMKKIGIEL